MPVFNTTVNTEVEIEFEVFCAICGAGLCSLSKTGTTSRRNMPYVEVEPCPKCLDNEKDRGYEDGYNSGYEGGLTEGETRCKQ